MYSLTVYKNVTLKFNHFLSREGGNNVTWSCLVPIINDVGEIIVCKYYL